MSLLLLFSDQIQAPASGDVLTSMLIETTSGTWVDITSDLISGTVVRGRQNQLDQYQAGTAEILLDNDDRKFDPTYAASPLNGYIRPMTRIQIRDTYAGVTYPLFTGSADRWTQNREGPHRGTTSLAATDAFKNLERARLASSAYVEEVLADSPVALWRLDEPAGSTVCFDSIGTRHLDVIGTVELGEEGLVSRDAGTGALMTSTATPRHQIRKQLASGLPAAGAPMSIEVVFRRTVDGADGALMGQTCTTPSNGRFAMFTSATVIALQAENGAGTSQFVNSTALNFDDNLPHHVVGRWAADGAITIWVDGVNVTSGSPTLATTAFSAAQGYIGIGVDVLADVDTGVYQMAAIYNTALSDARIAAHSAARATPWNGDLPGARINRVLDAVDWPTLERDIDTGTTTLQSAELDMSALEHAQKVSDTEFGNLYVTAGGVVRFEDRAASVNQPVLFAFSDAAGAGLPISFSNPEISDEQIRNDVTVSRLEGAAQNAKDAASIATYQISSYTRDGLYNSSDSHSRYLAQFILEAYKDPAERVSNMVVNPYTAPATLWPAVLGLELTDRITLAETPQWVTPAVTRTLVVEGITHTFGPKTWAASFNVSETTAATQAYWALGVAGFSELGQTTRLFL